MAVASVETKRCRCEAWPIPATAIRQAVRLGHDNGHRFYVFAFEHTPRRWEFWAPFKTRREAKAWCRGKFPVSCGVRIVQTDANGQPWNEEEVFQQAASQREG